jgi:lipopolysaccharide biosynthesis protein
MFVFLYLPNTVLFFLTKFNYISKFACGILAKRMSTDKSLFELKKNGSLLNIPDKYKYTSFMIPKHKYNLNFEILKESNEKFKDKNIVIFAHYDPEYIIDDYVKNYLNELSSMGYIIVFVSTNKIKNKYLKLTSIDNFIIRKGEGYDFTNWSCAFAAFPELFLANEILLCNDSVFAPINPLKPLHEIMNKIDCDFWGLSDSKEILPHLQSYYIVFRKKTIQTKIFRQLFQNNYVNNRKEAIFMETNLTLNLVRAGLKPASYVVSTQFPIKNINYILFFWEPLVKWFDFPIIKRNLLVGVLPWIDTSSWKKILSNTNYDLTFIISYLTRLNS